jgi:hypothetical protein
METAQSDVRYQAKGKIHAIAGCHAPTAIPYSPAVRLHANPSDWIEKSKSLDLLFSWGRSTKMQLNYK